MVHSKADYDTAMDASDVLFGKGTIETLSRLKESDFLAIFEGVPQFIVERGLIENKPTILELLTIIANVFPSKSELRRLMENGGLSINKQKALCPEENIGSEKLLNKKYLLIQKGKKNYFLIIIK